MNKKIAYITGGTKGIGYSLAQKLSAKYHIIITGRNFTTLNTDFDFFKCDFNNIYEVQNTLSEILKKYPKIDLFINNAGVFKSKSIADSNLDDFDNIINVNLKAPFYLLSQIGNLMANNNKGLIVNINSIVSKKIFKNTGLYTASKKGLEAITSILREEIRAFGVDIIDIFPGAINTEIWSEDMLQKYGDRMMKVEDVADAIYELIELSNTKSILPEEIVLRPKLGDL